MGCCSSHRSYRPTCGALGAPAKPCAKLPRSSRSPLPITRSLQQMELGPRLLAATFLAILPTPVPAQKPPTQPRPITVDDLFQIRDVSDPQLSPDAQSIAYTVKTLSLKEDKSEERIWAVPTATASADAIPMTAEGVSSSHPRWS